MIVYKLQCGNGHEFESWFNNSNAFDEQRAAKKLICAHAPACKSRQIEKAPMAPSVARGSFKNDAGFEQALEEFYANAEDVGDRFVEEVRDTMKPGEMPERGIIGSASLEEAQELIDEGYVVTPMPALSGRVARKKNELN